MNDPVDWTVTSWEGNRRQQHREYLALSFREKLEILEQMAALADLGRGGLAANRDAVGGDGGSLER